MYINLIHSPKSRSTYMTDLLKIPLLKLMDPEMLLLNILLIEIDLKIIAAVRGILYFIFHINDYFSTCYESPYTAKKVRLKSQILAPNNYKNILFRPCRGIK